MLDAQYIQIYGHNLVGVFIPNGHTARLRVRFQAKQWRTQVMDNRFFVQEIFNYIYICAIFPQNIK